MLKSARASAVRALEIVPFFSSIGTARSDCCEFPEESFRGCKMSHERTPSDNRANVPAH